MYKEDAKKQNPACWKRIEAVIQMAKMTPNAFALYIGLARGENLYQIKRGNNGVSLDVANRIVAKFPKVDKLWLLTGDGDMFSPDVPDGPWSVIGTSNSEAFRGWAAGLVLPELLTRPNCSDPYTAAVECAEKLQAALAKKGGQQ